MTFRRIALTCGLLAVAAGLLLMNWGPTLLKYLGSLVVPDFGSYSLIRLAGAGLLAEGALLLVVRSIEDAAIQRRIGVAIAGSHGLGGLVVLAQQIAIWDSPLGAILTVWLWLPAVAFGFFVLRMSKIRDLRQAAH